ncbi:MAG: PilZ domain-containing protein [Thermoanaerobaculales bacterium]|nr:PilZ domain-containing protein [Thermoanaerobaculales bacterium]
MKERRRAARLLPEQEIFGRIKATVPARIVDISLFGVQVEVPSALRPSVECNISLPVGEQDELRLRARIQRCRVNGFDQSVSLGPAVVYRAGMEFEPMNSTKKKILQGILAQIRIDGVMPGSEAVLEMCEDQPFAS